VSAAPGSKEALRAEILRLTRQYYSAAFAEASFEPGASQVPYAGRVFDADELETLVDSSLDFWLTTGRYAAQFEKRFAKYVGVRNAVLTNSGSSANLLAVSALTSPKLGDRRLMPGDEVITVAAGFPTTVAPILQNRLVPVFVDIDIPTYNIDTSLLDAALSSRTRAIMVAHTLGNLFDLDAVTAFARKHDLWLIEDTCDALGGTWDGRNAGTFGDISTVSFYPAHHITMGEGGCLLTDKPLLKTLIESFRDWGRDCWCEPGKDNTCGKRFEWQLGDLPCGYDHKFTYAHAGYNLKLTDMQAAVGVAQLDKLPQFVEARKRNFATLYAGLEDLREFFILPEATPKSDPSWFGFPISVRPGAPFTRNAVVRFLNDRKIATRNLFAGNLVRQPAFRDSEHRVATPLVNTDFVMERLFWIGVYPGLSQSMLDYVLETLHEIPVKLALPVLEEAYA
jgi:CDP-6-deoxy-D-xylo-4-hexulose-3-dehydrase